MIILKDGNTVVLAVIGAIVIGGAGFFLGKHTNIGFGKQWANGNGPMMAGAQFERGGRMMGKAGYGRHGMMGGVGEITKIDGNTVTVKLSDDTTKEITLSEDTVVNMMTKGSTNDLKVGQTIMVNGGGFLNDAQTIIVRP